MPYDVEVQLPEGFVSHNAIQPGPVLHDGGYWYLTIYGIAPKEKEYRQHVLRWKPNERATIVPIPAPTNARGSIGVHAHGAALFSFQGLQLRAQEIEGFVPAPLDARVSVLVAQVAELQRIVAELQQTAPAISKEDRAALDWVNKVRAIE